MAVAFLRHSLELIFDTAIGGVEFLSRRNSLYATAETRVDAVTAITRKGTACAESGQVQILVERPDWLGSLQKLRLSGWTDLYCTVCVPGFSVTPGPRTCQQVRPKAARYIVVNVSGLTPELPPFGHGATNVPASVTAPVDPAIATSPAPQWKPMWPAIHDQIVKILTRRMLIWREDAEHHWK